MCHSPSLFKAEKNSKNKNKDAAPQLVVLYVPCDEIGAFYWLVWISCQHPLNRFSGLRPEFWRRWLLAAATSLCLLPPWSLCLAVLPLKMWFRVFSVVLCQQQLQWMFSRIVISFQARAIPNECWMLEYTRNYVAGKKVQVFSQNTSTRSRSGWVPLPERTSYQLQTPKVKLIFHSYLRYFTPTSPVLCRRMSC